MRAALATRGVGLVTTPGVTIVPPAAVCTSSGTPYQVFTPYWRAWRDAPRRAQAPTPDRLHLRVGVDAGAIPGANELVRGPASPHRVVGGERPARDRLDAWVESDLNDYDDGHDDPAGNRTSRLSADLHFGCLSPLEVAERCSRGAGGAAFVRQLCWRDFHHQVLHHRPEAAWSDWRPRPWPQRDDPDAFDAWRSGRTGVPIVDAGMRQLLAEGWMHNRLRMITASVLTKHLLLPWQDGARHFLAWLVDADVANNALNWQWVAGRGADTRPNRLLSPLRQARRFDPDGRYVRQYVPELAAVDGGAVHEPWRLGPLERSALDYPDPIIDLEEAAGRFRAIADQGRVAR
jgi:deoxyribodipyrimidine photo-lyase